MSNAAIKGLPTGSRLRDLLAIAQRVTKVTRASHWPGNSRFRRLRRSDADLPGNETGDDDCPELVRG